MNHSTGISGSYYRATEQELLEDYLKAVGMLSVNDDKITLQKQVAELTEKSTPYWTYYGVTSDTSIIGFITASAYNRPW